MAEAPVNNRMYEFSPYLKENTVTKINQSVDAVQGKNRRLQRESYRIYKYKMQS
jgi:hypothetical protein